MSGLGWGKSLFLYMVTKSPAHRWSPSQRLTPDEALRHEWIMEVGVAVLSRGCLLLRFLCLWD